jgi:hypothetical protein
LVQYRGGQFTFQEIFPNARHVDRLDTEYLISPDWILDELREAERVSLWTDAQEYMATVKRAYRRDYWQTQPHYVELWSEKATVQYAADH